MFKYSIGQKVQVRPELKIGAEYYSENNHRICEVFTPRMSNNLGKVGTIISCEHGRYKLDIDEFYRYTDEMLQLPVDYVGKADYTFNPDVEALIEHVNKKVEKERFDKAINKAIDSGDKERFKKLSDEFYKNQK